LLIWYNVGDLKYIFILYWCSYCSIKVSQSQSENLMLTFTSFFRSVLQNIITENSLLPTTLLHHPNKDIECFDLSGNKFCHNQTTEIFGRNYEHHEYLIQQLTQLSHIFHTNITTMRSIHTRVSAKWFLIKYCDDSSSIFLIFSRSMFGRLLVFIPASLCIR